MDRRAGLHRGSVCWSGFGNINRSFTDLKSLIRRLGFEKDAEQAHIRLLIKRVQRLQSEIEQLLV